MAGAQLPLPTRIARNINLLFRLPFFIFAALSFRTQQIMLGTTITKILVGTCPLSKFGFTSCPHGLLCAWSRANQLWQPHNSMRLS